MSRRIRRARTAPAGLLRRISGLATYAAIRAGACVSGALEPRPLLSAAKRAGGWFGAARFNRKRLQRAIDNLAVAFPEWTEQRRRDYAVRSYEHLMMLGMELAYSPRMLTLDAWAERVRLEIDPVVVQKLVDGRPVIFVTGHCGNWELSGYILALLGFRVHALYRPLDLAPLDRWVRETRRRRGLELIDKFGAARKLPQVLARGDMLGFIADQNAGDRGLFVPFFNRLASSYKAIGLTAIRYNATVIIGLAERYGGETLADGVHRRETEGMRYRIICEDLFGPDEYLAQPDPVFYITSRWRRALEVCVRRAPEQYLWMHRYWKSRPRFERDGKPFPKSLLSKLRALPWMTESQIERIQEHSRVDTEAWAREHPDRTAPDTTDEDDDSDGLD